MIGSILLIYLMESKQQVRLTLLIKAEASHHSAHQLDVRPASEYLNKVRENVSFSTLEDHLLSPSNHHSLSEPCNSSLLIGTQIYLNPRDITF